MNPYAAKYAFYEVLKIWRFMISSSYDILSLLVRRARGRSDWSYCQLDTTFVLPNSTPKFSLLFLDGGISSKFGEGLLKNQSMEIHATFAI